MYCTRRRLRAVSVAAAIWCAVLALCLLTGCGARAAAPAAALPPAQAETPVPSAEPVPAPEPATSPTPAPTPTPEPSPTPPPVRLIVIDPGHQSKRNAEQEPVGPGASQTKAKVSAGTQGRFSKVPEYEVNLNVSLLLRDELLSRGYEVIMTRETNSVDISNAERAALANEAGADAFIRIHCNGSEDPNVHGALTIAPTPENPYPVADLYYQCRSLARCVLTGLSESTGAKDRGVWETDTMSGINWCQVPVTIVEMGYMTNEAEDWNLVDSYYQTLLVEGIANGIDAYFALGTEPDEDTE